MAATPSYGRVGLTFIGDLSGDGKPELIIPQEDKIHVYTYGIKAGNSQFRGYDPMEKVDNPKIALIPETRFKSNKPFQLFNKWLHNSLHNMGWTHKLP